MILYTFSSQYSEFREFCHPNKEGQPKIWNILFVPYVAPLHRIFVPYVTPFQSFYCIPMMVVL